MSDVSIRISGRVGRITLTREHALNALSQQICRSIDAALIAWADDPAVALVVIDAAGERAFCAGGDIADIHAACLAGDYDYGRDFWAREYRMNARISLYPKPVVTLMQGFTLGGGVGLGCHGTHRVVGESSRIAMPECGIGIVPDVGGSLLLSRAPGRLGEYLGITGARMGPGDANYAGFADHFIPQDYWPNLIEALETSADATLVKRAAIAPPEGKLAAQRAQIDRLFSALDLRGLMENLATENSDFARDSLARIDKANALAAACTLMLVRRLRNAGDIQTSLQMEYRFTYRAMAMNDFAEGIRAAIIDRDGVPDWHYRQASDLPDGLIDEMLSPLGAQDWHYQTAEESP